MVYRGRKIASRYGTRFERDRRGTIAIMFAILAIPLAAVLGLAIDYALLNQSYSAVSLAATSASINAVKVAASGLLVGDANYVTEGEAAGSKWFTAQLGKHGGNLTSVTPSVTVTPGTTLTAKVTVDATMASVFGRLYGSKTYAVNVTTGASIQPNPYVDITLLIDNSSSMLIGATPTDIATMLKLTPCSIGGAYYPDSSGAYPTTLSGNPNPASYQKYEAYQCSYGGGTYDGTPSCLLAATSPYTFSSFPTVTTNVPGPTCKGYLSAQSPSGKYPMAGPPCAFACHFASGAAGTGNDFFGLARSTIGASNEITLRFDVVKAAAAALVNALKSSYNSTATIGLNIFTFDTALHPLYPSNGSYGNNWTSALSAIGAKATAPNTADTGIQPSGGTESGDTDFTAAMESLTQTYLTAAGTGKSAASPRKVLFLITDGVQDSSSNGSLIAFSSSACQSLQSMGYSIYVLYTTYYPLMNWTYLKALPAVVETTGSDSVSYNLLSCATSTQNYINANSTTDVTSALLTFFSSAVTSTILLTK